MTPRISRSLPALGLALLLAPALATAQATAGGHVALQGTYIEVGVNYEGYFGLPLAEVPAGYHASDAHNGNGLGFIADYRMNGWTGQFGGDYFTPGSPFEGFMVKYADTNLLTGGGVGAAISTVSLVDTSTPDVKSAVWTGHYTNGTESFQIVQTYKFGVDDLFFTAHVTITNDGPVALPNLRFARAVDPDNDVTWPGGGYTTTNDVLFQPDATSKKALVTGTGMGVADMTLGLGTVDARAIANIGSAGWFTDVDQVISPITTHSVDDTTIGLAFLLGDLAPGASTSLDYAYILSQGDLEAALGAVAGITILAPSGTVSGGFVPFEVTTTDVANTTSVDFYVDGVLVATVASPTNGIFSTQIDTTPYPNGPLALRAVATVAGVQVAKEISVNVSVDNSGAPIVFDAPIYHASVSGAAVPVQVSGTDAAHPPVSVTFTREVKGLSPVDLGTDTTAPFTTTFDATGLLGGTTITIRAVALDGAGHETIITTTVMVELSGPTFKTTAGVTQYANGGTAMPVDAGVRVAAPANLDGATVSITGGFVAGDVLAFVDQSGITGSYDGATGVLTLVGSATPAAYQAALRTVTISSPAGAPDGQRSVTFASGTGSGTKGTWGNGDKTVTFVTNGVAGGALIGTLVQTVPYGGATDPVQADTTSASLSNWRDDLGNTYYGNPIVISPVMRSMTVTAVYQAPPTMSATITPTTGTADTIFELTASIAEPDACGEFDLFVDGNYWDWKWVNPGQKATFTFPGYDAGDGAHEAYAYFYSDGCGGYMNGATGTVTFTVGGGALLTPDVFVGSTVNPSYLDGTVTFTTEVAGAGAQPTGTVTFLDGATPLCSGVALSGGIATCPVTGLTAGDHAITVAYAGDAVYEARTSGVHTQQVLGVNGPAAWAFVSPSAASQSATVGQAFALPLAIKVTDAGGLPVVGLSVAFSLHTPGAAARATLSGGAVTTDADGVAQVDATANTVAGEYLVDFGITGLAYDAATMRFALANAAGAPASLAVTASPATAVVGSAFGGGVVAVLSDAYGNLLEGVDLTFSAPVSGATASLSAAVLATDAQGRAQVDATAGTVAGTYAVTVSGGGLTGSANLENLPDVPAALVLDAGSTPQTAQVATTFGHALGVTVEDAHGNAVPGATVSFTAPASGARASLSSASVEADEAGHAQVTATAGTVAGSYAVAVASGDASGSFSLRNLPGAPGVLTLVSGDDQHATVDAAFATALAVNVTDAHGNPVPAVAVSFTAPATGARAALSGGSASTDAAGNASVTATAGTVSGAYAVSASADGVASPVVFHLANDPGAAASVTAAVSATPQSATVGTAYAVALSVAVEDSHGNAVPDATVAFAAPGTGATATLSAASAVTSAAGLASVNATASLVAGSYSVSATVTGLTPATFALTNLPGAPAQLVRVSGSPQQAVVDAAFTSPLVAEVRDANQNPVSGVTVTFTAPASGARAAVSPASATSGADGRVSTTATAGTVAGTFQVSASAAGVAAPVAFDLTNVHGAAATMTAGVGSSGQSATVGAAFGTALSVTVVDSHGNPVPGVSVAFACPASGPTCTVDAASATTSAAGVAAVHATAGTLPGTASATASATGLPSVTFALTSLVGPPGSIAVVSGSSQTAQVYAAFGAPLAVLVKDAYANPVPGATVSFEVVTTGAQGAVLSAASATTDAAGAASVTASANAAKGSYSVTAAVTGAASPASFALQNTSVVTALQLEIGLPVYSTAVGEGGKTHFVISVGPEAGGHAPTGTLSITSTRSLGIVTGQAGVVQQGAGVVATLVNGAAAFDVIVKDWHAQDITVAYVPDAAAALTWDAVSETQALHAEGPTQNHDNGGCSTGGGGGVALLPLLLLALRGARGRSRTELARRLGLVAVLAAVLVPGGAQAQVVSGLRLGYALPVGDVAKADPRNDPMKDEWKAQFPLQLDVGWRVLPRLVVGGYGSYGYAQVGALCTGGAACSARVIDLGVQATWRFALAKVSPWAGAGIGWEWAKNKIDDAGDVREVSVRGPEVIRVMGGVDWTVGDRFVVGPFAQVALGRYSNLTVKSPIGSSTGTPPDPTVHTWFTLGVRGAFETLVDPAVARKAAEEARAAEQARAARLAAEKAAAAEAKAAADRAAADKAAADKAFADKAVADKAAADRAAADRAAADKAAADKAAADKAARPSVVVTEKAIDLSETVKFVPGQAVIAADSQELLRVIAETLKAHPEVAKISVEGYTDSTGSVATNVALSKRRAAAVVRWLVEKGGIALARLSSTGFGPEKPIADNATPEGRAANRRVELHIVK